VKSYKLLKLEDYGYAIVATSYINPLDDVNTIEQELRENKYSGDVLFDLLLCNGLGQNRYAKIRFNGERFEFSSIKLLVDITESSKNEIFAYMRSHDFHVDASILPTSQKYLLSQGDVI